MPFGQGIMKFSNGDELTGSWKNGKINGKGEMKYRDNSIFRGN